MATNPEALRQDIDDTIAALVQYRGLPPDVQGDIVDLHKFYSERGQTIQLITRNKTGYCYWLNLWRR